MMPITAIAARDDLRKLIAEGRIADRQALQNHVEALGLRLLRNGTDYITIITPSNERARLYLPQGLHLGQDDVHKRRDGAATYIVGMRQNPVSVFSAYMIVSVSPKREVAAYVGSASLVRHRLAEHFHGRDGTSCDLADWSRRHHAKAFARSVICTNDRGGAIQLEGCLTAELEHQGWLLPGVTRWGAARRAASMMSKSFHNSNTSWPPPVVDDVLTWTPLSHFKFYG